MTLDLFHSAGLGLMFCILATVTGSIWAKFNWGSFWNWDPRETSIFILLLIYGAYFALRSSLSSDEVRARLSAVYSILAGLTAPFFIFVMPRIVSGLHPERRGMKQVRCRLHNFICRQICVSYFSLGIIGFSLLFIWLLNMRIRVARLEYKLIMK